jgi:type I restriction enzyme M protein
MKFVPEDYFMQTKQGILTDLDILICKDGALTGKIAMFKGKLFPFDRGMVNEHIFILRTTRIYTQKYLFNFLFSKQGQELLKLNITGAAQGGLNRENLLNIQIPLPPKDIQEKIVTEIEMLEEKEKNTADLIASLKKDISVLFLFVADMKTEKLGNIAVLLRRGKSAKYGKSNIQIIKSGQARGYQEFDFSERHFVDENFTLDERKLEKGDILINSTGVGTAGRVTLFNLDGDFVVDSHITILRVNKSVANPIFVLYVLAENIGFKNIESMAQGQSGQIELSLSIVQNIDIPLPPLSEQQKIVSKIEKIEAEIQDLQKLSEQTAAQKAACLKKYL